MPYPESVTTDRLRLRRWQTGDRDAYAAIWADDHVRAALSRGQEVDPAEAAAIGFERQLATWERNGFGLWAAIPDDAEHPAGWIGAWHQDVAPALDGEIEIGWTLRHPWWGRGLATEGAIAAITTAFEHLRPPRVISLIPPGNDGSAAVASRLGMTAAGETAGRDGLPLVVHALDRPAPGDRA